MAIDDSSFIDQTAVLYSGVEVRESTIAAHSVVGDMSRVISSELGHDVRIDRNNLIKDTFIDAYSYTGPFDMIFATNIGKFCSISYGVTLAPPEHNYRRISTHPFIYQGSNYGILDGKDLLPNEKFDRPSLIGNDVWIGCNATVLRGVTISDGAIVAANALVKEDVPPYAIVAGVPAKVIKYRFSESRIERLLSLKWWNWSKEQIRENKELFLSDFENVCEVVK